MAKTAADILIEGLIDWGVDTVYGLPGDGINGIMEALRILIASQVVVELPLQVPPVGHPWHEHHGGHLSSAHTLPLAEYVS